MEQTAVFNTNQNHAPLLEALAAHVGRNASRWHTPGHKGIWTDSAWHHVIGEKGLATDLTELSGLDNLHRPTGPIAAAEALAAQLYGADRAFFLINGSSAGLQAALLSLPGERTIVLPRHAHRSIVASMVLSGHRPYWVQPDLVGPWSQPVGPGSESLGDTLSSLAAMGKQPAAVVLIHPTYQGYTADLAQSIKVCHSMDVPVLVDAAHGAHLRFHDDLPPDPLRLGADAVVYSFHKTLGAATGAAVLFVQGKRFDSARIQATLALTQTSSPSYLLLASLDAARRAAALGATSRLAALLPALHNVRNHLHSVGYDTAAGANMRSGYSHDPTKLIFSLQSKSYIGSELSAKLEQHGVDLEMAELSYALALVTPADTPTTLQQLSQALTNLIRELPPRTSPILDVAIGNTTLPQMMLTPAETYRRHWQEVPLAAAAGRIAAALVSISPPGTATLVPGEWIANETVESIQIALAQQLVVQGMGANNRQQPTLMVVAE